MCGAPTAHDAGQVRFEGKSPGQGFHVATFQLHASRALCCFQPHRPSPLQPPTPSPRGLAVYSELPPKRGSVGTLGAIAAGGSSGGGGAATPTALASSASGLRNSHPGHPGTPVSHTNSTPTPHLQNGRPPILGQAAQSAPGVPGLSKPQVWGLRQLAAANVSGSGPASLTPSLLSKRQMSAHLVLTALAAAVAVASPPQQQPQPFIPQLPPPPQQLLPLPPVPSPPQPQHQTSPAAGAGQGAGAGAGVGMGGTWQGVGGAPASRGSMVSQLPSGMLHLNREEEDGVHGVEMPFELKAMEICLDEVRGRG